MRELDIATAGMYIKTAAVKALIEAQTEDVFFTFNEIVVPVTKADTVDTICQRYDQLCEQRQKDYEGSDEQKRHQQEAENRKTRQRLEFEAFVESLKTADESQLRDLKSSWPQTMEDLTAVFTALTTRSHDYGTSAYAMSIFAEAAINLMAHSVGSTGFQASCADLDFIRRTRCIDGPFALIKGHDMLYPQYDIPTKMNELLDEWRPWAQTEAKKLLDDNKHAHPNVIAHWESLAEAK